MLLPEITHPLDAVEPEPFPDLYSIPVSPGVEWVLCVRNSPERLPKWTEFFEGSIDLDAFAKSRSVSALLILPTSGRFWAITFGQGRHLLRDGVYDERFGLITALNAIEPSKIRAIDKFTFDSPAAQNRQQATDDTDLRSFGIDVEKDLLSAVTGVPRDSALGRRLTGRDALSVTAQIRLGDLPTYLERILAASGSENFRGDFPWIDNVFRVRDKAHRRSLDRKLVEKFRSGDFSNCWLALPEIVDWARVGGFTYTNPSPRFEVDDLHLRSFLESSKTHLSELDVLDLKNRRVLCLDEDGRPLHGWNAYRCLYAEVYQESDVYLLTNNHWYRVNRDLVDEIEAWYEGLEIPSQLLPEIKARELEKDYNERAAREHKAVCFDEKIVHLPLNRGKVEFCDLLAKTSQRIDLVHENDSGAQVP